MWVLLTCGWQAQAQAQFLEQRSLPEVPLHPVSESGDPTPTQIREARSFAVFLKGVPASSRPLLENQDVGLRRMLDIGPCPRGEREEGTQEREKELETLMAGVPRQGSIEHVRLPQHPPLERL